MGKKITECGDANPGGNVYMTRKGGCRKEVSLEDAYRCTGCDTHFHKECIIEHFRREAGHDWGRQEERKRCIEVVRMIQRTIRPTTKPKSVFIRIIKALSIIPKYPL